MSTRRPPQWIALLAVVLALVPILVLAGMPVYVQAEGAEPVPIYQTLEELAGKRFAYVNGSVYDQRVQAKIDGTSEDFYASLPDCVAAVEADKADAAVQISYCCQLVVNRKNGTVALLPEYVDAIEEAYFFPKGSPLVDKFDQVIEKFEQDGTIEALAAKWVGTDESTKTLPKQDWPAPNGTLKFATSGVLEPFSYAGPGGKPTGYDVELALLIAKELGYHLDVSAITMDAIFASVQAGKVDFGGTLTNTPERAKMVDFTRQVMPCYIAVIVKAQGADAVDSSFFAGLAESFNRTFVEEKRWKLIASGLGVTALISVCSGVLGTLLGFATVLARRSGIRWLAKLVDYYQALMGGVPLVVVLMVLYYVVFGSLDIAGELVAILAFTLAFGATSGSTMWTAVSGIDVIQEETGLALGYTSSEVFQKIIFPQAAQQFLPQLMGQFVSLVKDTSIVGYIAVQDLTRASDLIRSRTMDAFFPLVATAIIYFVVCRLLARILAKAVSRIDVTNKPRKVEGVVEQ
ncbi:MAG: ABC transporter permease subunit [Atopobiaceae bacterium]|nr:ABC transporter permease subunit [Atopobiaceae bacterium]